MNFKSKHVKLIWDPDSGAARTARILVSFIEKDGLLAPGEDQTFEIILITPADAWVDLTTMLRLIGDRNYPTQLRLDNGKLLSTLLWLPLMDALMRFVEVLELGLPPSLANSRAPPLGRGRAAREKRPLTPVARDLRLQRLQLQLNAGPPYSASSAAGDAVR